MINDLSAKDIVTPIIIAPSNDVIDFPINFAARTISFRTISGNDTHHHSVWELATNETFTNVDRSFETASNANFAFINNLNNATTYFLRVKFVGESGNVSNWSSIVKVTTIEDHTPKPTTIETPRIVYPTHNLTDVSLTITADMSVFTLSQGIDAYDHSVWELSLDSDFTVPIKTIQSDTESSSIQLESLNHSTDYYLRAKHVSKNHIQSKWSPGIKFTTTAPEVKPIVKIETPNITELYNNATNVSTSFVVPVTEFVVANGTDVHDYSIWEVSTDSVFAFTDVDYVSKSNVFEQAVDSLRHGKIYYIRVRHVGKSGSISDWSPVIKFTTIPQVDN